MLTLLFFKFSLSYAISIIAMNLQLTISTFGCNKGLFPAKFCRDFQRDFRLLMDVNELTNYKCLDMEHVLNIFIINPLIHIHQTEKIASVYFEYFF